MWSFHNCREKESKKKCINCNTISCFDCIRNQCSTRRTKDGQFFKQMTDGELNYYAYKCNDCFGCRDCKIEQNNCKRCVKCDRPICFNCIRKMENMKERTIWKLRNMTDEQLTTYDFKCSDCYRLYFFAAIICKVDGEIKMVSAPIALDYYPTKDDLIYHLIKEQIRYYDENELGKITYSATLLSYSQLSEKQYRNF